MSDDLFESREVNIGHNSRTGASGMDGLGQQLTAALPNIPEWLNQRHALVINRLQDLTDAISDLPKKLNDDTDAEKASDIRKQLVAANKAADACRVSDKKLFDEPGKVIHQFWGKRMDATAPGMQALDKLLKDYLRAKQEKADAAAAKEREKQRLAAEKAVAKGKEPPPPVATPKPVATTRVHGDLGSSTSTRKVWTFKDANPTTIDLEKLRPYLTQEAIESAVRQYIRNGGRELAGVTIFEDIQITTR
jgi:hypothetical protein